VQKLQNLNFPHSQRHPPSVHGEDERRVEGFLENSRWQSP
jgi:hypothetical protein